MTQPAAPEQSPESRAERDPYAALRHFDFRTLIIGRFIAQLGEAMVSVAIGYELYLRTRDPFLLGLVGLVQVVPVIFLALPAGYIVDRYDRKRIVFLSQAVLVLCSAGLALVSATQGSLVVLYGLLTVIGVARAFNNPAESALTPQTVPPALYANAATWNSTVWQTSAVVGPALAGFIIDATTPSLLAQPFAFLPLQLTNRVFNVAGSAVAVYVVNVFAGLILIGAIFLLRNVRRGEMEHPEPPREALRAGIRFLGQSRILLGAITLDMFAVLFGGATALLPIYATDILRVDATGFGFLRAAPSVGALLMAVVIARLPPFEHAGRTLLLVVAGFGVATIVFGYSTNFWLSLAMLALLGALDNVSVIIRSTLFMSRVPDVMRGRVGAINSLFIGISNEMGSFRAGLFASVIGSIGAVVTGGIGTLIVVGLVAWFAPELRRLRRL